MTCKWTKEILTRTEQVIGLMYVYVCKVYWLRHPSDLKNVRCDSPSLTKFDFGQNTGYTLVLRNCPQSLQTNARVVPHMGPQLFHSWFLNHCSLVILTLDSILSAPLRLSLDKTNFDKQTPWTSGCTNDTLKYSRCVKQNTCSCVFSVCTVLGDANFPSTSVAKAAGTQVIHADGHNIPTLLRAILQLMPLDKYVESPVSSRFCACIVILSDNHQLPHLVGIHIPLKFNFQNQLNRRT
jgi:hypothetical protein